MATNDGTLEYLVLLPLERNGISYEPGDTVSLEGTAAEDLLRLGVVSLAAQPPAPGPVPAPGRRPYAPNLRPPGAGGR